MNQTERKMVEILEKGKESHGVVSVRAEFEADRDAIETDEVTEKVVEISKLCTSTGLELVMGGAISIDALPNLKRVHATGLTRFETRKVVFAGDSAVSPNIEDGLLNAVHFELLWLLNKRDYYSNIKEEDHNRIEMLESRWQVLGKSVL